MLFGNFVPSTCAGFLLAAWVHGVVISSGALGGGAVKSQTVVVLYADANDGRPGHVLADRGIRATFAAAGLKNIEVHSEHLDVSRFHQPSYQQDLAEFFRRKYAEREVKVVIAALASGLDFALQHRETAFPGVPIVYCGVDHREANARRLPQDVIGVPVQFDLADTLDVALRLHPGTRRVYVITGKSRFDDQWRQKAQRVFRTYEDQLEFVHLAALPLADLLKQVAQLPADSIVYYVHIFQDGNGEVLIPAEALKHVAEHANVPTYSHVDTFVGRGIVGGRVISFEEAGQHAATLGLRILRGETPAQIGHQKTSASRYLFDARQLARWGINPALLPTGSAIRNQNQSFWELYRWQIIGVMALCVVEALLIFALLVQRVSRQRAEASLRRSQAELRELTARLLQAQETERRSIARELHDDLNQGLALLAVELDLLARKPPTTSGQLGTKIGELSSQVRQLSSSVHELSHQLHPAKLEQLGLVAALRGLCQDMTHNHGLPIDFQYGAFSDAVSDDTALCLYRIAQEALQNVIKHSAARSAQVELAARPDAITLRISDDGKGFDVAMVDGTGGLGLVSMRERLRLVQGEIAIDSQPAAGARIEVRVPR